MPFSWLKSYFGPSTLVTAAFIGPGTITVCTLAGANYGYTLLWALLFSVLATVFLQEMSARLGLITQSGFGEAIREGISYPPLKWAAILLVLSAIGIGNAAYEAGNISGAVLGLNELFGFSFSGTVNGWAIGIGSLAVMILFVGSYKTLERVLIGAVGVMSLVFVGMAILVKPDIQRVLQGLLIPTLSSSSMLTALALVGTTVVPYNLFLHATAVQQRYHEPGQLSALRKENVTAILLGGVISMGVVITSAAAFFGSDTNIASAADMASQLEPVLGGFAPTFLGLGLCAAGLTSAITAPLAAAYAVRGVLGWDAQKDKRKFMAVWGLVLLTGTLFSSLGIQPVQIIQFAQIANGMVLPFIAIFLLILMNKTSLLGSYVNTTVQNAIGAVIVIIAVLLGLRSINSVLDLF